MIVGIVDYGMGNVHSLYGALNELNVKKVIYDNRLSQLKKL